MVDWDARYLANDAPWELGGASPPLADLAAEYRADLGRVLVPGCGRGADALHIASLGAEVTAWDIAPTAIQAARATDAIGGLSATFEVRDALDPGLQRAEPFDTWIEHTFFCALDPALRPRYVEAAARLLRPDGLLLGVFFIGDGRQGPPFAVAEPELRALLERRFRIERLAPATNSPGHWAGCEVTVVARAGR